MAANATKPETTSASEKSVWVKQGPMIRLQKIEVGETDEAHYEVISGLNEGDEVVLSMSSGSSGSQSKTTAARSPFMPQRPGSNRKTNNNAQPPQP
jgi:HlyD family secretion protein